MAEKSNLEKILNLKNDEEFKIKGYNPTFRIHNGRRQFEYMGEWLWCDSEEFLANIINDPSLIQREPRFSDEEMTFLRLLHKYGKVMKIYNGNGGASCRTRNGKLMIKNIGESLNLNDESTDLDEMFKEDEDAKAD